MTQPIKKTSKSAIKVNQLHAKILTHCKASINDAIEIGGILEIEKEETGHGAWAAWVKANLSFSQETAGRYMRCHSNRDRLKSVTVTDLTSAYKMLTDSKSVSYDDSKEEKEDTKPVESYSLQTEENEESEPEMSKAPARLKKEPKPTDKTGLEIPNESTKLWNEGNTHTLIPGWSEHGGTNKSPHDLIAMLRFVKKNIEFKQETSDPLFRECDYTGDISGLNQIIIDIERAIPHAICHVCNGKRPKNCDNCKGRGFVSKFFWDNCCPPEIKTLRTK